LIATSAAVIVPSPAGPSTRIGSGEGSASIPLEYADRVFPPAFALGNVS
jgi:hypothetical protein